jgi:acetyltransferase EpsM
MSAEIIIIGAGAHARKIWLYAKLIGIKVRAFVDDNPVAVSPSSNIPCLHSDELSDYWARQLFVVAIGNPVARKIQYEKYLNYGWTPIVIIHPLAYVAEDAKVGPGSVVCANAVVESGSLIGTACIIGIGVFVDHDCVVADYAHLTPGTVMLPSTRFPFVIS